MRSSHFKWPLLEVQGMYSIEVESVLIKICTHKKKASIREKNLKDVCFLRIFTGAGTHIHFFFPIQTLTLLVKVTQENKKRCQLPFLGLHGGKS